MQAGGRGFESHRLHQGTAARRGATPSGGGGEEVGLDGRVVGVRRWWHPLVIGPGTPGCAVGVEEAPIARWAGLAEAEAGLAIVAVPALEAEVVDRGGVGEGPAGHVVDLDPEGAAAELAHPATGLQRRALVGRDLAAEVRDVADVDAVLEHDGEATIASYTVTFDGQEPTEVIVLVDTPDGSRSIGRSSDAATIERAMTEGLVGRRVRGQLPAGWAVSPD